MADLSRDDIMSLIQDQYPELVPLLNQDGVWDAISQAVENSWSPARLQAALQATPYYRSTPANERAWFITATIDPATAAVRSSQYQQKMSALIAQTGVNPNGQVASQLLHEAIVNNWSDTEFRMNLVTRGASVTDASGQTPSTPTGELATNATQVHALAASYGIPLSDQAAIQWATQLTSGAIDQNALRGTFVEYAKSLYPGLSDALDSGLTTRQFADPYAQIAAKELNINPGDFNLSDPKWSAALSQVDPKTGAKVPLSLSDWQSKIRTDANYGYDQTPGAQQQAAQFANTLLQKFGNQ